ncbi:MAG: hypothetical protein FRX49_05308 [Trebouxia sp. A1-2]|nr:MAG: hypothetical protein FRX49_05308 [Trebouxia sp. A1-2]
MTPTLTLAAAPTATVESLALDKDKQCKYLRALGWRRGTVRVELLGHDHLGGDSFPLNLRL